MGAYISAHVVIDAKYDIKLCDYQFTQMVGKRNFGYFGFSIHPDDLPKFKDAADALQYGENKELVFHMLMADESYQSVAARLYYATESEAKRRIISVRLFNLEVLDSYISESEERISELSTYLTMTGGFTFSYDKTTDYLVIEDITSGSEMELYSGTLQDWKAHVEEFEMSKEAGKNLEDMYAHLQDGKDKFATHISFGKPKKGTITMLSPEMLKYSFYVSGKHVTVDNKDMVYGFVSLEGAKGRHPASMQNVQEMDTAFDVLNKKGITDFAKTKIGTKMGRLVYLCIVDIDNFKNVNDIYGHLYGDEVIRGIINIMKLAVDDRGIVGRIGGDEFMIILDRGMNYEEARKILQLLRANVEWAYGPEKKNIGVTVSIGCAEYPDNADNYQDLFAIADKMLYRAKEKGKNRYIIYEPEIHGDVLHKNTDKKGLPAVNSQEGVTNKEGFAMKFNELLVEKKTLSFSVAVQRIGRIFGLDEVDLFKSPEDLYSVWEKEPDGKPKNVQFALEKRCQDAFDENNRLVIDTIRNVQGFYPMLYEYMQERNIHVMFIYRCIFKEGGYCLFIKKSESSRKWAHEDVILLTLLAHMMDMELNYRE